MTSSAKFWSVDALSFRLSLTPAKALAFIMVLTCLTHLPTSFGRFFADDFLLQTNVKGDAVLYHQGFGMANPNKSWWQTLADAFHFYSPAAGTLQAYKHYGNLPWWTSDQARLVPFRPLAAATHWLDFSIAPKSLSWQRFHTLIYVLLFAWAGWVFYQRLFARVPGSDVSMTALLATLLLVMDFSHLMNFNWVSARNVFMVAALAVATLNQFMRARETSSRWALAASCFLFVLALLTAEAAVGILGYLFAYQVWMDKGSIGRRLLPLLPFATIVVVWRALYNYAGFGASGIGLYVDPGHSPLTFLASALHTIPVLLAAPITTIDGLIPSVSPQSRTGLALAGLLIFLAWLLLVKPLLNQSRIRFLVTGSVLAAIPAATLISGGPRSGVFISLGFFGVLACWLRTFLAAGNQRWRHGVVGAILLVHLLMPALFGFCVSSKLLPVTYQTDRQYESALGNLTPKQMSRRSLVVVNSAVPSLDFYLPFQWRIQHGTAPANMSILAPSFVTVELRRLGQRRFELYAPEGLPLNHLQTVNDLNGQHPIRHFVYGAAVLQGLFASPKTRYVPGEQFHSGDILVTVTEVENGRPERLMLQFNADSHPDQMLWQWYDWKDKRYRKMNPPRLGETLLFPGPLDVGATEPDTHLPVRAKDGETS